LKKKLSCSKNPLGPSYPLLTAAGFKGNQDSGLRLEKQQINALKVANWLKEQRWIEKVFYVGLPDHEGYEISQRQASGFGA
jgi:cystathionine gamma-synthase